MKKLLSIILCITITFSCVSVFAASSDDEIELTKQMITEKKNNTPDEEKDNHIFVKAIDDSKTEKILKEALKDFEYEIVKQYELGKMYLVKFQSVQKADEAIDILNARKDIKFAEPNYRISLPTPVIDSGGVHIEDTKLTEESNTKTSGTSVPYSDWAKSDIEKAIALNIINVGGNYNFPSPITREEFCELIYNYCYNVIKEVDTVTGENKFTDTTNSKIIRLNAMGIINGKSETEFAPNDLLTREEAATILTRLISEVHHGAGTNLQYITFEDAEEISYWAMESIQSMCKIGIMNGVGNGRFAPQEHYTTEQAIITLVRMYNRFVGIERKYDDELLLVSSDNTKFKLNSDISTINKKPVSQNEGRGDGFHWTEHSYEDIFVKALIADDNSTNIILISTSSSNYKTPRGIKVGDSLRRLQEEYTEDLRKALSDEVCYIYEPPMIGFNRIYFYCANDVIIKIVIENRIDG